MQDRIEWKAEKTTGTRKAWEGGRRGTEKDWDTKVGLQGKFLSRIADWGVVTK